METRKNRNWVRSLCFSYVLASQSFSRRTFLPRGVKQSFEDRMEKKKKEDAIKKLQAELREEKEAEIQRSVQYIFSFP